MKLQNRKTGEIGYTAVLQSKAIVVMDENAIQLGSYTSLAALNAEWEDVPEEPKSWWYIDCDGEVFRGENADKEHTEEHKSIGNYYNSSKEAEKAVEKLKAWKRLKDKGFSIYSWGYEFVMVNKPAQTIILRANAVDSSNTDLDLLFSGEDN